MIDLKRMMDWKLPRLFLISCVLSLSINGAQAQQEVGEPKQLVDESTPQLTELEEKVIDVQMTNNTMLADATVVSIKPGKVDNSIKSLRVQPAKSKRAYMVSANKVSELFIGGAPLDVEYDSKNKVLIRSPEKRDARLAHRAEAEARLAGNGDHFWEPLTDAQHEKFKQRHAEFLEEVTTKMPNLRFRLVETEYFMFYTVLEPAVVDGYIVLLDAMYAEMCKAFGLSPEKNIWCHKCVVICFQHQASFQEFEANIMGNREMQGASGICHQAGDGDVIFAGYRGGGVGFAHTLVHETAHGFVHRYLSTARAPSWLNEGMSDWLAGVIVNQSQNKLKQLKSAKLIVGAGGWGDFLTKPRIDFDEYGAASSLVDILLSLDKGDQFKQFFDGIKEGKPADLALKESFGMSFEDLKIAYAQRISRMR